MTDPNRTFHRLRPRLHGIAYRMLGSRAEAEDVVQDAWLRWHEAEHERIDNAEAWLVTVTTRIAIDRLRAAKVQREHYIGTWLPEPVLTDGPATPEETQELSDEVSTAFLFLLERLTPEARAAFLLREVLDADYAEVAQAIGKSEAACRQIVHRAKAQLREGRAGFSSAHADRRRVAADDATAPPGVPAQGAQGAQRGGMRELVRGFADALSRGDFNAIQGLLAEDAVLISDGGGVVPSFGKPLLGARRIAQLYYATRRRLGAAMRLQLAQLNGEWALLRFVDGVLESAQTCESDGRRITRIQVQRNPAKLARLAAEFARQPQGVSQTGGTGRLEGMDAKELP